MSLLRAAIWGACWSAATLVMTWTSVRGYAADGALRFNRDIRPILAENCFACHGPDKNKRQAELRLDTREGALADHDGHAAIVPGQPEASELLARLSSDDPDVRMPPAETGKSVSPAKLEVLRRWIAEGARWEAHWSFAPVARPEMPTPREAAGLTNPIDPFIQAKLEEHGLAPSPEADRVTLVRRLSFDLVGLPPAPEEVEAFVADGRPDAYERLVDRLLSSPHYGERMAMCWLDLVRYADTTGIHGDNHRDVAPYRDYVIGAFNDNLPYDRFTIEQLAGDLLPDATLAQRVASGYNRMNMTTTEGGAQAKEYIAKYAADRVRNVAGVWLGATLGCAQCHDHKYDPFTTRDFYRFAAFFGDIFEEAVALPGPPFPVPKPDQAQRLASIDGEIGQLRRQLDTPTDELATAQARWEQAVAGEAVAWTLLKPSAVTARGGATLVVLDDQTILASGPTAETEEYTLSVPVELPGITALRIEALPHDSLPAKGPGRYGNGNFVLSEIVVSVVGADGALQPIKLQNASASFEQRTFVENNPHGLWSAASAIDGDAQGASFGWAALEQVGRENHAVFETAENIGAPGDAARTLAIVLQQNHAGHALGRFRISATTAPRPVRATTLPAEVRTILATAAESRTAEQRQALATYYRSIAPQLQPARDGLADAERRRGEVDRNVLRTLVSMSVEPRTMRVLARGNWLDESGEVVLPGVPGFLPQLETGERRATRLDLARWLASPDNPLVARAWVNRLWKLAFGRGISTPLDDLGAQGAWPTHPEVLDVLASELIASGWDTKHVWKLLVMSRTYRQSSAGGASLARDPYNLWLARQGRFRLDAEMVRDNALATSGLLVPTIGGASVRPYQPPGYWSHLNFPVREYQPDHGESLYRRGLYTYWCRTFLHPSLLAFDAPSREECTAERNRSNTPLQALVLLNDPIYVEAARALATHIVREGGATPTARIAWAFRRALARPATADEQQVLAELLAKHAAEFAADPTGAARLLAVGESPLPSDLSAAELAAWTSVARVILNLHETLTRN